MNAVMSLRAFGRLARAARHKLCVPTLAALQHASLTEAPGTPSVSSSDSPAFYFHNHFRVLNYGVAAHQLPHELETYRISVITGNVRGAGTPSTAWVQLIGSTGESEKYVVGNSGEEGLSRGSKVTFEVQVPRDIGALRRVLIQRDKGSFTNTGDGWYLDHIEVDGPHGAHYTFPCHAWFGQSDCGDFAGGRRPPAGGVACIELQAMQRQLMACMGTHGLQAHASICAARVHAMPMQGTQLTVSNAFPSAACRHSLHTAGQAAANPALLCGCSGLEPALHRHRSVPLMPSGCTCLPFAGPMERNLIPAKEEKALPPDQIFAEPVQVVAAGVAFPHPDKVGGCQPKCALGGQY